MEEKLTCGKCNDSKSLDMFLELGGQPEGSDYIQEAFDYLENYIIECEKLRAENITLKDYLFNLSKSIGLLIDKSEFKRLLETGAFKEEMPKRASDLKAKVEKAKEELKYIELEYELCEDDEYDAKFIASSMATIAKQTRAELEEEIK